MKAQHPALIHAREHDAAPLPDRLGGQGLIDETLDADHVFIALWQGAD